VKEQQHEKVGLHVFEHEEGGIARFCTSISTQLYTCLLLAVHRTGARGGGEFINIHTYTAHELIYKKLEDHPRAVRAHGRAYAMAKLRRLGTVRGLSTLLMIRSENV